MKALKEIVSDNNYIDGHIHLFDDRKNLIIKKSCVGFADIRFDRPENFTGENMCALYNQYIKNYLNKNTILLATGLDAETAVKVYNRFPEIKGFGEMKCYDEYHGAYVDKGNLDWIRPIFEYIGIPVYIHFDINSKRITELDELLKDYPKTPVVLCHCGMKMDRGSNYAKDSDTVFEIIKDEMTHRENLWCDLSWAAGNYFTEHKDKLIELPQDRIFVGTDYNPECEISRTTSDKFINHMLSDARMLASMTNSDENIKRLFNI